MAIRDEEKIRDILQFYKDKDVSVHVSLKPTGSSFGGSFRNGKSIELKEDCVVFNDEKLGEILIFLSDIFRVDKREDRR